MFCGGGGGSKSAKGGPNPLADMDRGGSKSASGFEPGVQIRCNTGRYVLCGDQWMIALAVYVL